MLTTSRTEAAACPGSKWQVSSYKGKTNVFNEILTIYETLLPKVIHGLCRDNPPLSSVRCCTLCTQMPDWGAR